MHKEEIYLAQAIKAACRVMYGLVSKPTEEQESDAEDIVLAVIPYLRRYFEDEDANE